MSSPAPNNPEPSHSHLAASLHRREAERVAALESFEILDTPREREFDDIAILAAEICDAPIAVVNLVTSGRQWFKAEVGLGVRETPLETSFCGHALLEQDFMMVTDMTKDPRFDCNPLVTAENGIRFYAGALLKNEAGLPIGTLCILDTRVRTLTDRQKQTLGRLARQAMSQIELRQSLRLQSLLTNELQHRVKNTLAMVQAIANQTFRASDKATKDSFLSRLVALGEAHETLTKANWTAAPIRDVIDAALNAHRTRDNRFSIDGPYLLIGPKSALSLSLALHELATNAAKYGALSNDVGRVSVVWSIEENVFRLSWTESGGPLVTPPTRRGFGSNLIERSFANADGGGVRFDYRPDGLRCDIETSAMILTER